MNLTEFFKRLPGDVYRLFFPPVCPVCDRSMPEGSGFMCALCRFEIPLTGYWNEPGNPVTEHLAAHIPVRQASAFFHYVPGSPYRELVHRFKYQGGWRYAREMGEWYGSCLAGSGLYGDIDFIVPVPLHRRKLLKRGYNQSEYIAEGISRALGVPVRTGNLLRLRHSRSQTKVEGHRRWDNVSGAFGVRQPEQFKGKHILLVDDVLTTGSTLVAAGGELVRTVEDVSISIAALAVAE
ncbi:MAG: ComF family protein [Alistipes sp.]|nr:ComF family protein [Alistipes sp.]